MSRALAFADLSNVGDTTISQRVMGFDYRTGSQSDRLFWNAPGRRDMADLATVALSDGVSYLVSMGNLDRTIRVTAGCELDCTGLEAVATGGAIATGRVPVSIASGVTVTIYAGQGATWQGGSNNYLSLTGPALVNLYSEAAGKRAYAAVYGTVTESSATPATRSTSFITAGQSLAKHMVLGAAMCGYQRGQMAIAAAGGTARAGLWPIQGATDGSAILRASSGSNYWVDEGSAYADGPAMTTFATACTTSQAAGQPKPGFVYFNCGQTDLQHITTGAGVTAWKAALAATLNRIDAITIAAWGAGSTPILVVPLGSSDNSSYTAHGALRQAALEVIAARANTYQAGETYASDRRYADLHPSFAGQDVQGEQLAYLVDFVLHSGTRFRGHSISSVTRTSTTTVQVVIPQQSGRTLVTPDWPVGFGLVTAATPADAYSATAVEPSSFSWSYDSGASTWTLTITTASSIVGMKLFYPWGGMEEMRTGEVIRDSATGWALAAYASGAL